MYPFPPLPIRFSSLRNKHLTAAFALAALPLCLLACGAEGESPEALTQEPGVPAVADRQSALSGACASGADVRSVSLPAVTTAIQNMVLRTPGPLVTRNKADGSVNLSFPTGKVVVLPFETPDFPRNTAITSTAIYDEFFASGSLTGITIANYFLENSYGQFLVKNGGIADWVTLTKNLSAYVGFEGDDQVPRDVLKKANINWAALDSNNDHIITPAEAQLVFLVANGYSAATRGFTSYPTGNINNPVGLSSLASVPTPSGTYTFLPRVVYIGTKKASDPTYATDPFRITSSICHELGHAFFNLPDRYLSYCGTGRTGQYDMMSNNCSWEHFTLHDKVKIGWVKPQILQGHLSQCLSFPAAEALPAALAIVPPSASLTPSGQYWLVENRYKPASNCGGCMLFTPANGVFDTGLPESGLAVYWVNTGVLPGGQDDVRLVSALNHGADPDGTTPYNGADPGFINQGAGALFKQDDASPNKILADSTGGWSLLWFTAVSSPASTVFAQF